MENLNDLQSMVLIACIMGVENWEIKPENEQTAIINFLIGFVHCLELKNNYVSCGFDINNKNFIVNFENEQKQYNIDGLYSFICENCFT